MSSQNSGHNIANIYKAVISDVINQVKEAFLDENVDTDVLHQLKKDWEGKLIASGSVDLEGPRQIQPPISRQVRNLAMVSSNHGAPNANATRLPQPGQVLQSSLGMQTAVNQPPRIQQVQYINANGIPVATSDPNNFQQLIQRQQISQAPVQTISSLPSGMIAFQPGQPTRFLHQTGTHQYIMHSAPNILPGSSVMILNANGQQMPVAIGTTTMHSTCLHTNQTTLSSNDAPITTFDGAVDHSESSSSIQDPRVRKNETVLSRARPKGILPQMDGLTTVSDSSSDDEEVEEEEDDPLRRIADRIGEGSTNVDDEEAVGEDEPLNSDDDQTDDEDIEKLFEADNLIVCQFERVHRARNKWKLDLKDGIMRINGKDHCFQRCWGEAEW